MSRHEGLLPSVSGWGWGGGGGAGWKIIRGRCVASPLVDPCRSEGADVCLMESWANEHVCVASLCSLQALLHRPLCFSLHAVPASAQWENPSGSSPTTSRCRFPRLMSIITRSTSSLRNGLGGSTGEFLGEV